MQSLSGTVVAFDERRGLGEVQATTGERYEFHCTAIADGTRTIAVGTPVEFDLMRKFGRLEASPLRPAP